MRLRFCAAALALLLASGCGSVEKPSSSRASWSPTLVNKELSANDDRVEGPQYQPRPPVLVMTSPPNYFIPKVPAAPPMRGVLDVPLGRKWYYIVIHHSDSNFGSAAAIDDWHKQRGWLGVGYHFVIGNGNGSPDGLVEATFRWEKQLHGAHAGSEPHNEHGIGICLTGDFDREFPTEKQVASLVALVNHLQSRCGIPASHILLHRHIKSTRCPGQHFPFYQFVSLLEH